MCTRDPCGFFFLLAPYRTWHFLAIYKSWNYAILPLKFLFECNAFLSSPHFKMHECLGSKLSQRYGLVNGRLFAADRFFWQETLVKCVRLSKVRRRLWCWKKAALLRPFYTLQKIIPNSFVYSRKERSKNSEIL